MAVKGNSKWKLKLIQIHRKLPMLDTFIMFILGLIAYPINEYFISNLLSNKVYSKVDLFYSLFFAFFDILIVIYFFKFSKEALNISINNKKYTMKDFDEEFIKCMTEDLFKKTPDERIEIYGKMHSLQIGTEISSLKNNKKPIVNKWKPNKSYDKLDKGDN